MPRKSATRPLEVPSAEENAAERKRVLNVIAQRRYRESQNPNLYGLHSAWKSGRRKKERLQALESRVLDQDAAEATYQKSTSFRELPTTSVEQFNTTPCVFPPSADLSTSSSSRVTTSPGQGQQEAFSLFKPGDWRSIWSTIDISLNFDAEAEIFQNIEDSMIDGLDFSTPGGFNISSELQIDDATNFTFPDDALLEVPSLKLLTAATRVAERLKIADLIWDFSATSPFYTGINYNESGTLSSSVRGSALHQESRIGPNSNMSDAMSIDDSFTGLPHLKPTATQVLIPHHPTLDLLPWPNTRNKLIQVFNLPIPMRPRNAQDPMALLQLVYDMQDDSGEGIRFCGQDPFKPSSWEIGQLMFKRWWWAFDMEVIERSNKARKARGQRLLTLEDDDNLQQ